MDLLWRKLLLNREEYRVLRPISKVFHSSRGRVWEKKWVNNVDNMLIYTVHTFLFFLPFLSFHYFCCQLSVLIIRTGEYDTKASNQQLFTISFFPLKNYSLYCWVHCWVFLLFWNVRKHWMVVDQTWKVRNGEPKLFPSFYKLRVFQLIATVCMALYTELNKSIKWNCSHYYM